jgi:hypothetical protein
MGDQPLLGLTSATRQLSVDRQDRHPYLHECWVYFYRAGDYLKIGISLDVESRGRDLQTGCPVELRLIGKIAGNAIRERRLHELFKAFHYRAEWYRADSALLEFVKYLIEMDGEDRADYEGIAERADARRVVYVEAKKRRDDLLCRLAEDVSEAQKSIDDMSVPELNHAGSVAITHAQEALAEVHRYLNVAFNCVCKEHMQLASDTDVVECLNHMASDLETKS